MSNQRLVKISQNRIYIAPGYYFALEETNLPQSFFSFKGNQDFFWQIEITAFDKATKQLTAQVIDYNPTETSQFEDQQVKSHFDLLCFENFEWSKLLPFLSMYRKSDLSHLLS